MTVDELSALDLPLDVTDGTTALTVESGLDWIARNTTFEIDLSKPLPANVKLFLVKFTETMLQNGTVASESIAGMSQSFSTEGAGFLLRQYASELLGDYYKSAAFTPAKRRWI